jgi:hypothetical protein
MTVFLLLQLSNNNSISSDERDPKEEDPWLQHHQARTQLSRPNPVVSLMVVPGGQILHA